MASSVAGLLQTKKADPVSTLGGCVNTGGKMKWRTESAAVPAKKRGARGRIKSSLTPEPLAAIVITQLSAPVPPGLGVA
jgi:hypothetical protein